VHFTQSSAFHVSPSAKPFGFAKQCISRVFAVDDNPHRTTDYRLVMRNRRGMKGGQSIRDFTYFRIHEEPQG